MSSVREVLAITLTNGIPIDPIPPSDARAIDPTVPHAPKRIHGLNEEEIKLALKNALRYFPQSLHKELAVEFREELMNDGHIYMRRFRPQEYEIRAYPIDFYPAKCKQAAAVMLMIMNNLDKRVAQYPHELITYGGNGSVFSNWAQYHLVMKYLATMTEDQTLVMYSGHPMGLFPSNPLSPRVIISNGMMIPNYASKSNYDRLYGLGVTIYGQMTAGSYCYIGPQGIVHGTTLTILNAARKYLHSEILSGKVYVSSGLGGMSGAQAKAAFICGAIGVIAEVDPFALQKRLAQGWLQVVCEDVSSCIQAIKKARSKGEAISIGFLGNVVLLWERLAEEKELLVDLGSDQTSLHNPYGGGYYPIQLSFEESQRIMVENPSYFKKLVHESLRRQVNAINKLVERGMYFWDYGNCFLLEASRAGADVLDHNSSSSLNNSFKYPSYVQHIMGDIFSLGFGPFRWVCTSGNHADLQKTDAIAIEVLSKLMLDAPDAVASQYRDNLHWIKNAEKNQMVVGSEARILYADANGRIALASAFNKAIRSGEISGLVVLSRDHHDVSGTDSPFRETSNIYDGSSICADMAVHTFVGDAIRGATWVALHNGGGVGWGEVMNGGHGMVLDGSIEAERLACNMLHWDVNNGISRRAWSGHPLANFAIRRAMEHDPKLIVTLPNEVQDTDL